MGAGGGRKGRLQVLREQTREGTTLHGTVGIGHTRWATHGAPSDINSHPHLSDSGKIAVVHNGIIENEARLRAWLEGKGIPFRSETDTEVVSNLVGWCQENGFEKITNVNDLKAGDIVFVRPHADGGPQHVFMLASDVKNGSAQRYDHGSDSRIMSNQPTTEPISYGDAPFMFAYRPVVTEENNIYYGDYVDKAG